MLPLAQIPVDSVQLAGFVGSAAALLVLYNQAKLAFGGKAYATKEDLQQAHGRMSRERDDARAAISAVAADAATIRAKLDTDMEGLRTQIAQNNRDSETRVNGLRDELSEQTKLIISVIRQEGSR